MSSRSIPSQDDLIDFVRTVVNRMLGHEEYTLDMAAVSTSMIIELSVADKDYPILVGRHGRNLDSLRTLAKQVSKSGDLPHVQIEVIRSSNKSRSS